MSTTIPLRAAIVGCGGMGLAHARALASLSEYTVVAGCDLHAGLAQRFADTITGASAYTDYQAMLAQRPDVVVVATNTATHAALTIQAAQAGVRGVYCEKPMATNLADAQAMIAACRQSGTALAVNHQRRTLPVFLTMRRLIEQGAIGQVELIRGSCAGDILSDGTHLVDTIRHLAGDVAVSWVFGQVYRTPAHPDEPRSGGFDVTGGWRYGHPVETGGLALVEFASGLRAELHTGTMQIKGRGYQDYEVFGSTGRLWRAADWADPPLLIQTDSASGWQALPVEQHDAEEPKLWTYRQFAQMVLNGADHPLSGESALADLELVMAIYESARLRNKIELPLEQPRFPLELLIERGEM